MHPPSSSSRSCLECVKCSLTFREQLRTKIFLALSKFQRLRDIIRQKKILHYVSHILELAVAEHYWQKTGEVIFVPVGLFREYDGVSRSRQLTFEVKFEKLARDTGNLCFEFSYRGRPSGIAATSAQRWVHMIPEDRSKVSCLEIPV